MRGNRNIGLAALGLAAFIAEPARAEDRPEAASAPLTIIVSAPGDDLDSDDAITLDLDDLDRTGTPDLLGALGRTVAGVSMAQAQGNPWQPNLIYRGFTASPLQGNAQGLAVYVDGARFNLPFGDTVNFDLLPDGAIDQLSIRDASAIYGLNALGGTLIVETKTGRSAPGVALALAGGDHDRAEASLSAGWSNGAFSAFVAGSARHEAGWRQYSPSTLYNGFVDLGWDGADAGLHVKTIAADTDLTGNGAAPVELLDAAYDAVFTHPDNTRNRYTQISLHPWVALGGHDRIEASLAWQGLRQRTVNGDLADIAACDEDDDAGLLCLETTDDEAAMLIGADGDAVAVPSGIIDFGLLNRSTTRSDTASALVQLVDRRALWGGDNVLTLGFSQDSGITHFASNSELGALTRNRSVAGLGTIIAQPDGSIAPVSLRVLTSYSGLFLSDRLPLGPRLTAEIGLRWNQALVRLDDQIGTALDGRHIYRRLNPGIEFDYRLSERLSLRAGYTQANRAPTPAELSCADDDAPCSLTNFFVGDPDLAQVVSRSWEAGASGRVEGGGWHGQWLLSFYRATNSNDIQFTASDTRGRAYFRNIGATRRQGIEASLALARGPWSLSLGYALTDATFRTPLLLLNSPDNPAADGNGQIIVQPGDRLPSIPRHRAVLSLDYTARAFSLGGDLQAQAGQRLVGDEGNDQAPTAGFLVVGLRATMAVGGPLRAFASVSNLFDRRYATFGTFSQTGAIALAEAPGASDPRAYAPGAPRRWQIGLRAAF